MSSIRRIDWKICRVGNNLRLPGSRKERKGNTNMRLSPPLLLSYRNGKNNKEAPPAPPSLPPLRGGEGRVSDPRAAVRKSTGRRSVRGICSWNRCIEPLLTYAGCIVLRRLRSLLLSSLAVYTLGEVRRNHTSAARFSPRQHAHASHPPPSAPGGRRGHLPGQLGKGMTPAR